MNPVISYENFLDYMHMIEKNDVIIPIILINPSNLFMWNDIIKIDKVLEYFHNRSGKEVTFFLPGYAHYPRFEFNSLFSSFTPDGDKASAFQFNNGYEFYYSHKAFTDFVDILESRDENYRYRGHTELLFAKYLHNEIDFNTIKCFDLTELFNSKKTERYGITTISTFLEDVLHEFRFFLGENKNINDLCDIVQKYYNNSFN